MFQAIVIKSFVDVVLELSLSLQEVVSPGLSLCDVYVGALAFLEAGADLEWRWQRPERPDASRRGHCSTNSHAHTRPVEPRAGRDVLKLQQSRRTPVTYVDPKQCD